MENKPIYELIGRITGKIKKKPSSEVLQKAQKAGKQMDEYFYQLNIICENKPEKKKVYIFKNTCETEKI
jgi:hypothetical protein